MTFNLLFLRKNFTDFYEASIRHDRALDAPPFITVSATDLDSGEAAEVEYQLQESSAYFTVGSSDGGIRLIAPPNSGRFNLTNSQS